MKITRNLGMLLLAIWLILGGLFELVPTLRGAIPSVGVLMALLALAAGVSILLGR